MDIFKILRILLAISLIALVFCFVMGKLQDNKDRKNNNEEIFDLENFEDLEKKENIDGSDEDKNYIAEGMAIGMSLGSSFGLLFNNRIEVGMIFGMILGMFIGMNIKK